MPRVVKSTSPGGPRRAYQLVIDAFKLYRRYPLLFLVLAAMRYWEGDPLRWSTTTPYSAQDQAGLEIGWRWNRVLT